MNESNWHTRAVVWLREGAVVFCALALVLMTAVFAVSGTQAAQAAPEAEVAQDGGDREVHSLSYTQATVLSGGALNIEREVIQVKIYVDGQNNVVDVYKGMTVEQALNHAGIQLGVLDIVNLPLMRKVEAGVQIDVERRARVIQREETVLPFETVQVATPLLAEGQTRVISPGRNGLEVARYERYIVEGEIIEETLLEEWVDSTPVTQTEMVGFNGASVSQMDFEWEFEEGVPTQYAAVHQSQKATGYTATGARTASGRVAMVGHVAVNPNVIPYGSKLYIQSADGKFVYGYAIAADTGGALLNGTVGVDLFYDTYTEAALNGVRTVDIYVLEYPA